MKPSPLELLIYKVDVEHEKLLKAMFAAHVYEHKQLPKKIEKFIDGKRVNYFEGKLKDRNSFEEKLSEVFPEILKESSDLSEALSSYWSSTNISPSQVALVQELRVVEGEIVITNSYQFKTSYVKTEVK